MRRLSIAFGLCVHVSLAAERASAQLSSAVVRRPQSIRTRRRPDVAQDSHVFGQQTTRNLESDDERFSRRSSSLSMANDASDETGTAEQQISMNSEVDSWTSSESMNNNVQQNQTDEEASLCKTIIAVGSWRIHDEQQPEATIDNMGLDEKQIPFEDKNKIDTEEDFVCELYNGLTLPISGTEDQMVELRTMLNNGSLISAQSTVEVNIDTDLENTDAILDSDDTGDVKIVTLPPGSINLVHNNNIENQNRRLAYYEGSKKTLVVRVTDIDGRSVDGDSAYISDKFFGTYGDQMTMKSGFGACSFGKFAITNNYQGQVDTDRLSAPGVVDVNVNIRLSESSQATVREASLKAAEQKLGLILPGPFDHVVIVVEACYRIGTECGFAA